MQKCGRRGRPLSAAGCQQRSGVLLKSPRVGGSLHATEEVHGNYENLGNGESVQKRGKRENTRKTENLYGNDKSQWALGTVRAGQGPEGPSSGGQGLGGRPGQARAGQGREGPARAGDEVTDPQVREAMVREAERVLTLR